jgi:hypothetical protein
VQFAASNEGAAHDERIMALDAVTASAAKPLLSFEFIVSPFQWLFANRR